MNAMVCERYGPPEVLQLKEVQVPAPKPDEILVKVYATTVTRFDCWMRSSTAPPGMWLLSRIDSGLTRPKSTILGTELAGEVEAVGTHVTRFEKGDQIFAYPGMRFGAYAEYACLPEAFAAMKPAEVTFEEAAGVPQGALTASHFLKKADIRKGNRVLVFGASGGVGSAAVQIAKSFGAEVTGVCSGRKAEFVRSLGADMVVDYRVEDFTRNGQIYDVILDTVGKTAISRGMGSLKASGCYLFTTFGLPKLIQILWYRRRTSQKMVIGLLEVKTEELQFIKECIQSEELKSVVDRAYPLEAAAEAHRYVESGEKKGAVVLRVSQA
jgi:NADPH:quinone reductase-like Zn-dependent oxidoreductase